MKQRRFLSQWIVLLVGLSLILSACAEEPVVPLAEEQIRDVEIEQGIVVQLREINPAAVPIYQDATIALDNGELGRAKELYEEVVTMAPEFSVSYRRLSYIETYLGNIVLAEEMARRAVEIEPISYNKTALASVLLEKNTPRDSQEAFDLASSAVAELPDDDTANMVLMVAAGVTNNLDVAEEAAERTIQLMPTNPLAHYYAGLIAASNGKWEAAEKELLLSQQLGMPEEDVQRMLRDGISRNALLIRALRWSAIAMGVWLLGLGMLYFAGTLLSRATIRAIETAKPSRDAQASPAEQRVRSIYRAVIAFLSLYFYISIPFVILALFLVVGGAFYLFFLIGRIPIQLALILVVMLLVSLYSIAKSLFSRIKTTPQGEQLARDQAPALWKLVDDVARKLDVRPVDAIYVNPYTGIAVNESGSILRKLRGAGRRNLMLGVGALTGMTQGQLASVLAHEYGHFSNKDTAGGDLAHVVYASLDQIAQGLIQAQATQIYNPVWLFLIGYQRIFLRVSLGASRLQEVLADRYAAIAYGAQNFIDGLESVIRQGVAFPMQADNEIRSLLEANQPITSLNNIYDLPMQDKLQNSLDKQFDDVMNRATSEYDSHPAPKERIQLVERLHLPYSSMENNQDPALNLFPNSEKLQKEMTASLMKNVRVVVQK